MLLSDALLSWLSTIPGSVLNSGCCLYAMMHALPMSERVSFGFTGFHLPQTRQLVNWLREMA